MKKVLIFVSAIFASFTFSATAFAGDMFDYICIVKKDVITGLPTDGQKLEPYEENFERRISFDLGTYEFFEFGEVEYLDSVEEDELVLLNDTEIKSTYDGSNFYKSSWKIDRRTGKSVESHIYYDSLEGKKITGTTYTELDCALAPFTEF